MRVFLLFNFGDLRTFFKSSYGAIFFYKKHHVSISGKTNLGDI